MFRIGNGIDVHRLVEGRPLILCGVTIPHATGLDGHSDADVAVHAVIDAVLGALALGDIGQWFPDSDRTWLGADSIRLLEIVMADELVKPYTLENLDLTIVAQQPKLLPFIPQMRENLSTAFCCFKDMVSVKATTTEKLGFCGREEGISAFASVLMRCS